MALPFEARVVSGTTPTSTGTKDFTASGITSVPVGAIVIATRNTAADSIEGAVALSWGVTDGTDEYCGTYSIEDGASTTNAKKAGSDDRVVWVLNATTGADLIVGAFDSFISGGIRINFTSVVGTARTIGVILFFGDDCDCKAFTVAPMVSGDTTTVTTGFETGFVLANAVPDLAESLNADMVFQPSIAIEGTGKQVVQVGFAEDGVGSADSNATHYSGILGSGADFGVSPIGAGHVVSIDQWNATTLRFASDGGGIITPTPRLIGLAVRPSTAQVQLDIEELTPTSNGDEVFTTGFRTGFAYAVSSRNTTGDTTETAMMVGVGGSDVANLEHVAMGANARAGVTTTETDSVFDEALIHTTTANGANDLIIAAPDARDATTVDLAFSKTVATARVYSVLWVEELPFSVSAPAALPALESAGTVTQRFKANAASSLPALTSGGDVVERFKVSAPTTLPALTSAGEVTVTQQGSEVDAPAVLPALTSAGAVVQRFKASTPAVLPALSSDGSVAQRFKATAPATLPSLSSAGAVVERFKVDAPATLPALTSSGSAIARTAVDSAAMLPALESSGAVAQRFKVSASAALPALMASGSVQARFAVEAPAVLPALTSSGAVAQRFRAAVAATLPALDSAGAVSERFKVDAPATLPALTSAGSVSSTELTTVDAPAVLPALASAGSVAQRFKASAPATLPSLQSAGDVTQRFKASSDATLPALTSSGTVAQRSAVDAAAMLPSLTSSGSVVERFKVSAPAALPALTSAGEVALKIDVNALATLPALIASGAVIQRFKVAAPAALPAMTSTGSVSVDSGLVTTIEECVTLQGGRLLVANMVAGRLTKANLAGGRDAVANLEGGSAMVAALSGGRDLVAVLQGSRSPCD